MEAKYEVLCEVCLHEWSPTAKDLTGIAQIYCPSCVYERKSKPQAKHEWIARCVLNTVLSIRLQPEPIRVSKKVLARFPSQLHPKNSLRSDGVDHENKIAFEFHGGQHYRKTKTYTPEEDSLYRLQTSDLTKQQEFLERGYRFIVIDGRTLKTGNIVKKIKEKLRSLKMRFIAEKIDASKMWREMRKRERRGQSYVPFLAKQIRSSGHRPSSPNRSH